MSALRRRVRRRVASHDRRAARLAVHFVTWMRDRDAETAAAVHELAGQGSPVAVADVYRAALRDYRAEAGRVRREHRELAAAEGRLDARVRRRRGAPLPELDLPEDCLERLDAWRERAAAGEQDGSLESRLPRLADRRAA